MKRYVGSIYGRANVPENVWAVLGWVHAQTWIKMIRSSVIYIIDTRSDHPYPYLGVYSSKYRPNTLPPNSIIFSFSLWIKAMTLRLHRRKWGWLHSNGNHTWFIYSIICPIYRFVSKLEPWFIWHCNAFEKLKKSREEAEDRDFSLLHPRKVFQW